MTMAYRINLNNLSCADRVRYEQAATDLGLDGEELIKALVHSFFESRGVKNPSCPTKKIKKFHHAQ